MAAQYIWEPKIVDIILSPSCLGWLFGRITKLNPFDNFFCVGYFMGMSLKECNYAFCFIRWDLQVVVVFIKHSHGGSIYLGA